MVESVTVVAVAVIVVGIASRCEIQIQDTF